MNQTQTFRVLTVKTLAIIGFLVTLAICVWLIIEGAKRAPDAFFSLAGVIESLQESGKTRELTLATEKSVVNSGESFQISWTDMKQSGEYHVNYTCTEGVSMTVRGVDGNLVPMQCSETLNLPSTVLGLFLTVNSGTMRLTDLPIKLTFTNDRGESVSSETRVTVANATIPVVEKPVVVSAPVVKEPEIVVPTPKPTAPKPVVTPAPKPVTTIVYPVSNPNGFTDLAVTTIGSGVLKNGVFVYTAKYDTDLKNAIKFDIKNIGTKTSGSWTFKTTLPGGQVYESKVQLPLKPLEHVEFTLGFDLDTKDNLVKITNVVYTKNDTNSKNDSATWFVVVKD